MTGDAADCDVLISGGGVAGLIAAAGFGALGFRVICVDPTPPVTDEGAAGADLRSTAFLQPSIPVLANAGLWDRLAPHATPLRVMRIVDAGGDTPAPRVTRDFDAADLSDQPFAWNLQNWLLRREITARLAEMPNVAFRPGTGTKGLVTRDQTAIVTLSDGQVLHPRLVVAADGRNSAMRQALNIGTSVIRYGQKALAFAVTHEKPHDNISTEVHRSGGPFTLVPLPDRDGQPQSAVVWMDRGPEIQRLAALPRNEFAKALNARSAGVLGHLTQATKLSVWPIIAQIAARFSGPRTALIAEAAHVVPPIGAQGLNMSLADLGALLELTREHGPGAAAGLDAYDRHRRPEAALRLAGIDALNRVSMVRSRPLRDLRALALEGIYALPGLRRLMMRTGLGSR
ncbi:UbiH/UbiF family hydroxylase [Paracoccus pacificus]|uniref:UbiH/UbiF family hydroxylase n=1 Tax=Paracoccus pacificus TaxID=1463598 RepID=A0ABW4RC47_9RHOB